MFWMDIYFLINSKKWLVHIAISIFCNLEKITSLYSTDPNLLNKCRHRNKYLLKAVTSGAVFKFFLKDLTRFEKKAPKQTEEKSATKISGKSRFIQHLASETPKQMPPSEQTSAQSCYLRCSVQKN